MPANRLKSRKASDMDIITIAYVILGYLAVPRTIWADKVIIGEWNARIIHRLILGLFLGWLLIPWWLLKIFLGSK